MTVPGLTAFVICQDEAAHIGPCLDSLQFCERRLVVDGGSHDDTAMLAQAAGAEVQHRPFDGFGAQKAWALAQVRTPWALSIDADERVTPALAREIAGAIAEPSFAGFRVQRLNHLGDRAIRRAGWQGDRPLRLFRCDAVHIDANRAVHERFELDGPAGELQAPLLHYSYRSTAELAARARHYGALAAAHRQSPPSQLRAATHASARFLRAYLLRSGWLEGRAGLAIAAAQATEAWIKYAGPSE